MVNGTPGWGGYYLSAYGIAVKHGFSGTEEEWLEALKGANVELRYENGALQWKHDEAEEWNTLEEFEAFQRDVLEKAENAQKAADRANTSAKEADEAKLRANASADLADGSAVEADRAAASADNAATQADTAKEAADLAAANADSKARLAQEAATAATAATQEARTATGAANAATTEAQQAKQELEELKENTESWKDGLDTLKAELLVAAGQKIVLSKAEISAGAALEDGTIYFVYKE